MDLAKRAYDQSYRIDPIVRSLLDTDFYKLLMAQFIYDQFPNVQATFGLNNRTRSVRLAEVVPEEELRAQLDHVRTLRFRPNELIWIAGATFYGQQRIFHAGFVDFLRTLRLPDYELRRDDGQYVLTFSGAWAEVTWWEIHALAIVSELKSRAAHKQRGAMELDFLYACAKSKLLAKLKRLRGLDGLALSEFGTRRRHSFLWQEWVVLAMAEVLGARLARHELEGVPPGFKGAHRGGRGDHRLDARTQPGSDARLRAVLRRAGRPSGRLRAGRRRHRGHPRPLRRPDRPRLRLGH